MQNLIKFTICFMFQIVLSSHIAAQVNVKFYNKTGYDLDSLEFQNVKCSALKNGEVSDFIVFPNRFFPSGKMQGKVIGLFKETGALNIVCGIPVKTYSDTVVLADVLLEKRKNKYSLIVIPHE